MIRIGEKVKGGEVFTVRLLNVECPEILHPKLGEQPFGKACKQMTTDLVSNSTLEIEYDQGETIKTNMGENSLTYMLITRMLQNDSLKMVLARVVYVFNPNSLHVDSFKKAQKKETEVFGLFPKRPSHPHTAMC
ncbi:thermonuclease family protein [Viridibacillus arvi]|uniref:thermonuclease family protein n=1 Tax=Viridibacillus arvi TaxID=263475 RepID=UPI003D2BE216